MNDTGSSLHVAKWGNRKRGMCSLPHGFGARCGEKCRRSCRGRRCGRCDLKISSEECTARYFHPPSSSPYGSHPVHFCISLFQIENPTSQRTSSQSIEVTPSLLIMTFGPSSPIYLRTRIFLTLVGGHVGSSYAPSELPMPRPKPWRPQLSHCWYLLPPFTFLRRRIEDAGPTTEYRGMQKSRASDVAIFSRRSP